MKKVLRLLICFVLMFTLFACGNDEEASVEITSKETSVLVGKTLQLTCKCTPSSATVTWSCDKDSIATITDKGVLSGVSKGSVKVTATITVDGKEYKAEKVITVTEEAKASLPSDEFKGICEGAKVYLTCVGQSDLLTLEGVLNNADIEENKDYTISSLLKASDIPAKGQDEKTPVVFLVTGTSQKGLGGASTDVSKETTRAQDFVAKAEAGEIVLIVFHIGGMERRGVTTDPILNVACPKADLMMVIAGGDEDNYFTNSSQTNGVELCLYAKFAEMLDPIRFLYNRTAE